MRAKAPQIKRILKRQDSAFTDVRYLAFRTAMRGWIKRGHGTFGAAERRTIGRQPNPTPIRWARVTTGFCAGDAPLPSRPSPIKLSTTESIILEDNRDSAIHSTSARLNFPARNARNGKTLIYADTPAT